MLNSTAFCAYLNEFCILPTKSEELALIFSLIGQVEKILETKDSRQSIAQIWSNVGTKINTMTFGASSNPEQIILYKQIQDLTKKLTDISDTEMTRKTNQSEFYLIKHFCVIDKLRLQKLEHLGISMQNI